MYEDELSRLIEVREECGNASAMLITPSTPIEHTGRNKNSNEYMNQNYEKSSLVQQNEAN
jgi:hypothetical protein